MNRPMLLLVALLISSQASATRIEPHYPQEAIDLCLSGFVVLKFEVSDRELSVLEVVESEPTGVFEEAAKKNLALQKDWYINRNPAGAVITDKFIFKIEDECTPKS